MAMRQLELNEPIHNATPCIVHDLLKHSIRDRVEIRTGELHCVESRTRQVQDQSRQARLRAAELTIELLDEHLGQYMLVLQKIRQDNVQLRHQRDIVCEDLADVCDCLDHRSAEGRPFARAVEALPRPEVHVVISECASTRACASVAEDGGEPTVQRLRRRLANQSGELGRLTACVKQQEQELTLCAKTQELKYQSELRCQARALRDMTTQRNMLRHENEVLRQQVQDLQEGTPVESPDRKRHKIAIGEICTLHELDMQEAEEVERLRVANARQLWQWFQSRQNSAFVVGMANQRSRLYTCLCTAMRGVEWSEFQTGTGLIQLVERTREVMAMDLPPSLRTTVA